MLSELHFYLNKGFGEDLEKQADYVVHDQGYRKSLPQV